MAIIRARAPNLAELCNYRPFLEHFDVTFFFSALDCSQCRTQLDAFGLEGVHAFRYTSVSDLIPSEVVRRALDYKVGLGSCMLSGLKAVLSHDYINVVDPIFCFTYQTLGSMRPSQRLIVIRWENIYGRYDRVWTAAGRANRVFERANVVICVSQAAASTLRLPPTFSGKAVQIYPGIDLRGLHSNGSDPEARRFRLENGRPTLLFVGRLQWTKGLQVLLVALHILRHQWGKDADLSIVGGGDNTPFKALAGELGLGDRVQFLGVLDNVSVRKRLAGSDIFCFPSLLSPNWMEQYGFALVEAMAHGLPIIASDSGSIREICGEEAVYASTGNAHSLAEGIARILRNQEDALARGEKLRQRAFREFDADTQGAKMLEAIL